MPFRTDAVLWKTPSVVLSAIVGCSGAFLLHCTTGRALAVELRDCSPAEITRNLQEATALQSRAEYVQSERTFAGVLACQKQSLPAHDLNIAVTLGNLGELKRLQRQFRAAETLLNEAISMHQTAGRTANLA